MMRVCLNFLRTINGSMRAAGEGAFCAPFTETVVGWPIFWTKQKKRLGQVSARVQLSFKSVLGVQSM
jgi:hypothetical protein